MESLESILGIIAALILAVMFSIWETRDARRAIHIWAAHNHLRAISIHRRTFLPVWKFKGGKGASFYRVEFEDEDGKPRACWLRCFHFFRPPSIEVIWI